MIHHAGVMYLAAMHMGTGEVDKKFCVIFSPEEVEMYFVSHWWSEDNKICI